MKTYKNLYSQLCTYDNLELAFRKARTRKTTKEYVIEFEADLEKNLRQLKEELEAFSYRPAPLTTFTIRDPKTRRISASHFRDRVVHHALCNVIEPIFDMNFIYDSFANRKGKGTHAAILRFETFLHKVTQNGRLATGPGERSTRSLVHVGNNRFPNASQTVRRSQCGTERRSIGNRQPFRPPPGF